jgi:hypothetical protein
VAPYDSNIFAIVKPAAPAPFTTIFTFFISFYATFKAFITAASVTIAVPCWSSWKIGKIFFFFRSV